MMVAYLMLNPLLLKKYLNLYDRVDDKKKEILLKYYQHTMALKEIAKKVGVLCKR